MTRPHGRHLPFAFFTLRNVIGPAFTLGFRMRAIGRPNLPDRGPAIIVGNHASFLDPFLISMRSGRPVRWLVTQEFYDKPAFNWLLRWYGTIPVGGGKSMMRSFRATTEVLKDGGLLGVFPEGGITRDGEMRPFRTGAAVIALRLGVPVAPVHVHGTYEALPRYATLPRLVPITIRFGPIIPVPETPDATEEQVNDLTARMREAVVALEKENRAGR